jgi:hypothetical protein
MATDLSRARVAAQSSHRYFTRALRACDDARAGMAISGLGGPMTDFSKVTLYRRPRFVCPSGTGVLMHLCRVRNHGEQSPDMPKRGVSCDGSA